MSAKRSRTIRTLSLVLIFMFSGGAATASAAPIQALILYDSEPGSTYNKLGKAYAIMLSNLLGGFDTAIEMKPVEEYVAGQIDTKDITFYLGSYYDNALPAAFLTDAATTNRSLVWFKYNLWSLAWNSSYNFEATRGFRFDGLAGLNAAPSAQNMAPGFYDTILYKQRSMVKYYDYDILTNTVFADPDTGITAVTNPTIATTVVEVENGETGQRLPYVIRSGNFWYVADMPFSYIGPRDRYLVIADLLHDMLGVNTPTERLAMIRLEDVGALTNASVMQTLTDYLFSQQIEFSIAAIPRYRDPLGQWNGGVPQEIPFAQATQFRQGLTYALQRGGSVVLHGYTHQYGNAINPWTGVSGDDFEFWDIVNNRPVVGDSTEWVLGRVDAGIAEFGAFGIQPYAWETPHYHASATANRAFPQRFDTTYNRVVYYTSDVPDFAGVNGDPDFAVGQFFPYIIHRDYYGQRILPENLGNIEYDISDVDPASYFDYTWQDLLLNAEYALVVRNGVASFFFHPFWLEPSLGTPGLADLQNLVNGINQLGFTWVDGSELTPTE
ncbi:DUF2334 domain-containing protein [Halopseudomonas laoshanensis]|uniref:DUF2334 domain-containing protein n=1 Tax=Halopseudomonas laoshanensis TaxID=2268758 RepID=UPI0037356401